MSPQVPESKLARAGVAGKAAVRVGLGHLGHKAKRSFMSKPQLQQNKIELADKNAKILFDALAQLRGTALKAAQVLSMEVDLLPETYRRELEKSCHQVPPLNKVLVRKALKSEFSRSPEELFKAFDSVAFAAASLGQVHKAVTHSGDSVAVKIQYPGLHVAIDSDLALIRKLVWSLPNATVIHESLDEIELRLKEELDYQQEAYWTRWFGERLKVPGVHVSKVFDDYCGQRVITTELLEGMHLEAWLQTNPSQEERNEVAQLLYDQFVFSAQTLRCLHADPNPGNYLFSKGRLGLIDFGCVKSLSHNFIEVLPRLLKAYMDDDSKALFREYGNLGMTYVDEGSGVYEDLLRPFGQWLIRPFEEEVFDFGEHSDYTRSGKDAIQRLARLGSVDSFADEFIFFDRTIYGLYKIFERMGATVRIRHHWILEESDEKKVL